MKTKVSMRNLAALGVSAALLMTLAAPRLAFAIANETVLCEGEITSSTDLNIPMGEVFSLGNVVINLKSTTPHCAVTTTTVTQVIQATTGSTPLVVSTMTEGNAVPLDTTGCSKTNNTPGITVSSIVTSSNMELVNCTETSIANTVASEGGAYTMEITPVGPGPTTCPTITGISECVSNSQ